MNDQIPSDASIIKNHKGTTSEKKIGGGFIRNKIKTGAMDIAYTMKEGMGFVKHEAANQASNMA